MPGETDSYRTPDLTRADQRKFTPFFDQIAAQANTEFREAIGLNFGRTPEWS